MSAERARRGTTLHCKREVLLPRRSRNPRHQLHILLFRRGRGNLLSTLKHPQRNGPQGNCPRELIAMVNRGAPVSPGCTGPRRMGEQVWMGSNCRKSPGVGDRAIPVAILRRSFIRRPGRTARVATDCRGTVTRDRTRPRSSVRRTGHLLLDHRKIRECEKRQTCARLPIRSRRRQLARI